MLRAATYTASVLCQIVFAVWTCNSAWGQAIQFDCPASCVAHTVDRLGTEKEIETVIPVSTTILDSKYSIENLRAEVFWNRNAHPVSAFAPQTTLQSSYDGPIAVKKSVETSYRVGASLSSDYLDIVTPSVDAGVSRSNSELRSFSELPPHELLVSSGTMKRGTGVWFEFKPSRIATLQGSRDLVVAFRVPDRWEGGVLQIHLMAEGRKKLFGPLGEDFRHARAFVMPVHVSGSSRGNELANEFVRSEQLLRRRWAGYQRENGSPVFSLSLAFDPSAQRLPDQWVHQLIQSGSDQPMQQYQSLLPYPIAEAADRFVRARNSLSPIAR